MAEVFEKRLSSAQEALTELTKLVQEYDEIWSCFNVFVLSAIAPVL